MLKTAKYRTARDVEAHPDMTTYSFPDYKFKQCENESMIAVRYAFPSIMTTAKKISKASRLGAHPATLTHARVHSYRHPHSKALRHYRARKAPNRNHSLFR